MDDDFNTPKAIAVLFDLARETNTLLADSSASSEVLESTHRIWLALAGDVLGILPEGNEASGGSDNTAGLMNLVIDLRKQARAEKNFALSDKLRDELDKIGIVLEDSKDGTSWKLK